VDLTQSNINGWIRVTGAETVCLPNKLLERIAAIDTIQAEPE